MIGLTKIIGRKNTAIKDTKMIDQWMKQVNSKATTNEGKVVVGQLSSLMNYYNKQEDTETKDIDWKLWEGQIKTKGLVDKIKSNFESLITQEYNSSEILQKVSHSESDEFRAMNDKLTYHRALWITHL